MRILSIIALSVTLALSASVQAKPTAAGQAMFNKLITISQINKVDKRVHVVVKKVGGSYTDGTGTIYIDPDDIKLCNRNMDCVASIVAHEIGHNVLGHVRGNNYADKQQEKDADLYAVKLLNAAGYNPSAGAKFFMTIGTLYGDDGGPSHPNNSVRVQYITQAASGKIAAPPYPWTAKSAYIFKQGNTITYNKGYNHGGSHK